MKLRFRRRTEADHCCDQRLRVIKQQLCEVPFQTLQDSIASADHEMHLSLASDNFKEGVKHFIEKRAPAFTGR